VGGVLADDRLRVVSGILHWHSQLHSRSDGGRGIELDEALAEAQKADYAEDRAQIFCGRGAWGMRPGRDDFIEIARDMARKHLRAGNIPDFLDAREALICDKPRPVGWYLHLACQRNACLL
jgi:hypothetical protein